MTEDVRWLEAGIFCKPTCFNAINTARVFIRLLDDVKFYSAHYFHEPNYEIRFRILANKKARTTVRAIIKEMKKDTCIEKVVFRRYNGEAALYGPVGFDIAKQYFENGSRTAMQIIAAETNGKLTSPNKWKPKHFHLNRYVHLFANQMGYSVWDEFKWGLKYSYNRLKVWMYYKAMGWKGR